ncbi:MAG: methyltransferase [Pseudomonadales bacterium]|nr:methyltransferase [Pseudomonadales bacterium]
MKTAIKFCYVYTCIVAAIFSVKLFAQTTNLSEANLNRLQELIDSPNRSERLRERNQYRHPLETLDFFEVRPELTVVEIWPGGQGGWYRSILQPYIEDSGTYIPVPADADESPFVGVVENNSADRVLVFRAHGFMIYDYPAQEYFDSIYAMLKPGGIFGIVDHRGDESIPQDPTGENGYVNQSHVLMLAETAGFELMDQAEINANPRDTKDYRNGVYSLPPTLRGSALNRRFRAQMRNIGESDRMSLKFIKQ